MRTCALLVAQGIWTFAAAVTEPLANLMTARDPPLGPWYKCANKTLNALSWGSWALWSPSTDSVAGY